MKKNVIILLCALAIIINASAQTATSKDEKIKAQIIALETSGWQAWKDKNAEWFKVNTAEGFLSITAGGISNKEQVIKSAPTDCNVKYFSLGNFQFVRINKKVVSLVYTAVQDGTCGTDKLAAKVRVAVTYVKRAGRWLEALYMEAPMNE